VDSKGKPAFRAELEIERAHSAFYPRIMILERAKSSGEILFVVMLFNMLVWTARGAEPTAFDLLKEGNRHIPEEVKDQVVQIRSEKSRDGLTPDTWFIRYYDIGARTKETELKFENGKSPRLRRPFRLFARAGAASNVLDQAKLKVDSNVALKTAQKDRLLEKLQLTNSQMTLENSEDVPVWKITFWAGKAREPGKTAEIGKIFVNAEDGKVVHRDLHLDRIE